jgi:uncharacterized repeat protein (TIGR01451 family)
MSRRPLVWGGLIALGLLAVAQRSWGQFPPQNIPPTRTQQTEEPDLADKKTLPSNQPPERIRTPIVGTGPMVRGAVGGAAIAPDPPTPVVSIHLEAPSGVSAGTDVEYKITVENKSQAPAHHVKVTDPIPDGTQLVDEKTDPLPTEKDAKHVAWELGTLKPGETRNIRVGFRPLKEGMETIDNIARVQFEHGQKVRTVLKRPQLVVRKTSVKHALEGASIACTLVVENTGEVEIVNIEVNDELFQGLHFVDEADRGKPVKTWKIPSLAPKQKQEFTYNVAGDKAGALTSHVLAKAERGALASFDWKVNVGPSPVAVKIEGPKQLYLNYPATYQVSVHYKGADPLDNVVLSFPLLKGMKIVRATPGSQSFKDRVQWPVSKLMAGETRNFSISVEMANVGTVPVSAQVFWHGPTQIDEVTTEFMGAVALHLALQQPSNPVRVGDKVRYTLTVSNSGTAPAKNVKLIVTYPVSQFAMDVDGTDGKQQADRSLVILVNEIAPKAKQTRTVTLKATAQGKAVFHVEMESAEHLPSGNVTREEQTTITE